MTSTDDGHLSFPLTNGANIQVIHNITCITIIRIHHYVYKHSTGDSENNEETWFDNNKKKNISHVIVVVRILVK